MLPGLRVRPLCAGAACLVLWCGGLLLTGCLPEQKQKQESAYLSLEVREKDRLPLAPHVLTSHARPTPEMMEEHRGAAVRFMVLDKRTLKIHRLVAPVGQRYPAPWGGALYPTAFANDLIIREGRAQHGPEGYFNPAVWVLLEDANGQPLHEGWLFARDSAQTAWDHPRYDLTFLGVEETATVGKPPAPEETVPSAAGTAAARKHIPSSPVNLPEPQDEVVDPADGALDQRD